MCGEGWRCIGCVVMYVRDEVYRCVVMYVRDGVCSEG